MHALLTPDDVSKLLVVPVPTLYAWRHRGIGPKAVRVGRHLRYDADDVQAWIKSHTSSGAR